MGDYDNFDETNEIFDIFQRYKFHVIESERWSGDTRTTRMIVETEETKKLMMVESSPSHFKADPCTL